VHESLHDDKLFCTTGETVPCPISKQPLKIKGYAIKVGRIGSETLKSRHYRRNVIEPYLNANSITDATEAIISRDVRKEKVTTMTAIFTVLRT
jgi:hypothetical protein